MLNSSNMVSIHNQKCRVCEEAVTIIARTTYDHAEITPLHETLNEPITFPATIGEGLPPPGEVSRGISQSSKPREFSNESNFEEPSSFPPFTVNSCGTSILQRTMKTCAAVSASRA